MGRFCYVDFKGDFMQTVTKTINGIEYTAVWKGMQYGKQMLEYCRIGDGNILSDTKVAAIVFSEIIISPKVSIDDFEDMKELCEVLEFGKSVLFGWYWSKPKAALKREVENDRHLWRLIFNDISSFSYNDVFNIMTPDEIAKANIALDITSEKIRNSMNKH